VHEYNPTILKFPDASVVTVLVSSGVATVPSPVVPTVYNWIVEFTTGCWPPVTVPLLPVVAAAVVVTEGGTEHPASKRAVSVKLTHTIGRIVVRPFLASGAPLLAQLSIETNPGGGLLLPSFAPELIHFLVFTLSANMLGT
jgi:hypothetical protein